MQAKKRAGKKKTYDYFSALITQLQLCPQHNKTKIIFGHLDYYWCCKYALVQMKLKIKYPWDLIKTNFNKIILNM